MSVNPKQTPIIHYKTLVNTVIFACVLILMFFFLSKACEAIRNNNDDETNSISAGESDSDGNDVVADENDGNNGNDENDEISEDDFVYFPVTPDTENETEDLPLITLTEEELNAALMTITRDQGTDYLDKFYFLTDSSLYGLRSHTMLTSGRDTDRVISGISSSFSILFGKEALVYLSDTDKTLTVIDAVAEFCPEYLLVSVGADDLRVCDDLTIKEFSRLYRELLTEITLASPDTKVICMPLLPGSKGNGINIYTAEQYNKYIHEAAALSGAYYIDIASAFASSTGYLRVDCDGGNSDLNTTGLKRFLDLLRSYEIPDTEINQTVKEE